REERGDPHHHRAEGFIAQVEIVVRETAALVGEDPVIWIRGGVFRHGDAKGGSLLHALEDEVDAVGAFPCHASLPGQDMVFLAHAKSHQGVDRASRSRKARVFVWPMRCAIFSAGQPTATAASS